MSEFDFNLTNGVESPIRDGGIISDLKLGEELGAARCRVQKVRCACKWRSLIADKASGLGLVRWVDGGVEGT